MKHRNRKQVQVAVNCPDCLRELTFGDFSDVKANLKRLPKICPQCSRSLQDTLDAVAELTEQQLITMNEVVG